MLKNLKLKLPLKDIYVTQLFGLNYLDFYKKLGMVGHNGIDFRAKIGASLYACHSGIVVVAGIDGGGGKCVEIITDKEGDGYKTIYYHLSKIIIKVGDEVKAGRRIGHTGNTGKYTTGPHLHLGLKRTINGVTQNKNNGYRGAIDPSPYLPKNWDKSNAWHRYGRRRDWGSFQNEIKVMIALVRYLKRLPTHEEINACTYGGWDREAIQNPAMKYNWAFLKKSEFLAGKKPFS